MGDIDFDEQKALTDNLTDTVAEKNIRTSSKSGIKYFQYKTFPIFSIYENTTQLEI